MAEQELADTICRELWSRTMFTALIMLQWLLDATNRSWEDFIRTPTFHRYGEMLRQTIEAATEEDLLPLWERGTEVCTSWAVLVSSELSKRNGQRWIYGDNGHRRAAWTEDGAVVDSSAR
ncbi:hypothetical protein BO71DRAFT_313235, partial [Aspergillus ellipticus CBS 707.79]